MLLVLGAVGAMGAAQAALTINSVDTPTCIGRGQTVPVPVNCTRASGSSAETITVDVPAVLEVVPALPSGCTLGGAPGTPQTLTCTGINPGGVGASGSFSFNVRGLSLGGGNVVASNAGPPVSSASDSFTVISGGDLSITKSIAPSATFINGQTATFTLTPALAGDSVPAGATLTVSDQLPGTAAEFQRASVSAPPGYSCNSVAAANASRTLSCSISGPLTGLSPITLQVRPTLTGAGGLINNAAIAPDGINHVDTVPSNDTTSLPFTVNPGADPRPEGSFPASAVTGTAQTLTIRFANDGPQTVTGGQVRAAIPAVHAASVALDWTADPLWRASGRLELRRSGDLAGTADNEKFDTTLVQALVARKLDRDWTLLARNHLLRTDYAARGEVLQDRAQLGLAYRDTDTNCFKALAKVECKTESDASNAAVGTLTSRAWIVSAHADHHPSRPWWMTGRVAAKWQKDRFENGVASDFRAQLVAGRLVYDVTENWDLGVLAAAQFGEAGARQTAFGVEAGYLLQQNLWLSAGVNFSGFAGDADLAGYEYTRSGVYIRLRFKFDKSLFKGRDQQVNRSLDR